MARTNGSHGSHGSLARPVSSLKEIDKFSVGGKKHCKIKVSESALLCKQSMSLLDMK